MVVFEEGSRLLFFIITHSCGSVCFAVPLVLFCGFLFCFIGSSLFWWIFLFLFLFILINVYIFIFLYFIILVFFFFFGLSCF
jgi:hypothetical protein